MSKKDIDWSNIGFGYMPTEARFVSNYKDGKVVCFRPDLNEVVWLTLAND